ncbi:TRAP transporter small permease subunit [Chloroflexota bacterium]
MVAIVIVGVNARYVFNHPLPFIDEYEGYLMVLVIMLPLSWVLRRAKHIRIPVFVNMLPPRAVNYLDLATIIVALLVITVLIIATTQLVVSSFASDTRAWSLMRTPLGPIQLIMPIGLSLFAIQILVEIARRIKALHRTG